MALEIDAEDRGLVGWISVHQSAVICQTIMRDVFLRVQLRSWRIERDEGSLVRVHDVTKSSSGAVFLSGHFVSNRTAD